MFHVKFADIGEGIHEGVLLKYFFKEGDAVKDGDSLFTLETDKVNAEIPSPVDGIMKKLKFTEGDAVNVGQVICIIDDGKPGERSNMPEGEALVPLDGGAEVKEEVATTTVNAGEEGSTSVVGAIEVSSEVIASSSEMSTGSASIQNPNKRVLATPLAKKMAKDLGVDLHKVMGSGAGGRIMKEDILKASQNVGTSLAETKSSVPQTAATQEPGRVLAGGKHAVPVMDKTTRVPMTMLRKTVAQNMTLSKFTIPHTAVMDEADVTELVAFRGKVKDLAQEKGVKLTYLAFFIKAMIKGLKTYPYLNASLDETTDEIVLKSFYNIGIAVDTPDGLMVPVVKNADQLSIFDLAKAIDDLSVRAREKRLTLDDLQGGSFTITNYGAVGASFGVPVIKHPEAGILGVGAIVKKPLVIDDEIVIRSVLPLSLSFDHRIIDGADAGRFVGEVKKLLANPELLLLS